MKYLLHIISYIDSINTINMPVDFAQKYVNDGWDIMDKFYTNLEQIKTVAIIISFVNKDIDLCDIRGLASSIITENDMKSETIKHLKNEMYEILKVSLIEIFKSNKLEYFKKRFVNHLPEEYRNKLIEQMRDDILDENERRLPFYIYAFLQHHDKFKKYYYL